MRWADTALREAREAEQQPRAGQGRAGLCCTYPACQEQAGAVGSSVVGQANFDAVLGQLVGIGSTHDHVPLDPGIGDLPTNTR